MIYMYFISQRMQQIAWQVDNTLCYLEVEATPESIQSALWINLGDMH